MEPLQSSLADKYDLYQRAVQEPDTDLWIITGLFESHARRPLMDLREDFSGTGQLSCMFVDDAEGRRAWAVDLDEEPLTWGREKNLPKIDEGARTRVTFVRANVMEVGPPLVPQVDAILAMNYSFFTFKTREQMRAYFARAREGLKEGGGLVLEVVGGPEMQELGAERTQYEDFTYVWDRSEFNPISNEGLCTISFAFPDGSMIDNAFTYDWRQWSIRELRELLEEAGFAKSVVYWEGSGKDGEGDRVFQAREKAPSEEAWIAFLVGWK